MAEPSPEAFETLVRDALDALPDWLAPYLARISVQIEERPPRGEEDTYALFDGPALGDDPVGQLPPVITLFRRPLVEDFGARPRRSCGARCRSPSRTSSRTSSASTRSRLDELGYG